MTDQPKEFYKLIVVVSFLFVGTQSLSVQISKEPVDQVVEESGSNVAGEIIYIGQPAESTSEEPIVNVDSVRSYTPEIISHNENVSRKQYLNPFITMVLGWCRRRWQHHSSWTDKPRSLADTQWKQEAG